MTGWQTHSTRTVYENAWIRVREHDVTRPDGAPGLYGVVEVRHPAVFVVPVTADDEVLMIRQHRYPIGRDSLEIPAGATDGEEWLTAGRRELLEETGHTAATWEDLGPTYSLNGLADAPGRILLARDLAPADGAELAEEGITEVVAVPWPDVIASIRTGEIHDGESLAALMHAAIALGRLT